RSGCRPRRLLQLERAPQAPVEVYERRLVPPVGHVVLRPGAEATLDAFPQPEVLAVDRVDGELQVRGPVLARLLGRRGLGDVEGEVDRAVVGRETGEHAPQLHVVRLMDEDGVGEERVELDRVAQEVPLGVASGAAGAGRTQTSPYFSTTGSGRRECSSRESPAKPSSPGTSISRPSRP